MAKRRPHRIGSKDRRPNLHYDLVNPKTGTNYGCPPMGWRYDRTTMKAKINEGRHTEKQRIARDLHDGIMNKLASTRLNLQHCRSNPICSNRPTMITSRYSAHGLE